MLHSVKKLSASSELNASGSGFSETTHISEDDLLAVKLSSSEWTEIASLLPVDNSLFFKWGGEIGEAAELTYSFVGSDFVDYDQSYYDVNGNGSISDELAASVAFGQQTPGAQPINYSDDEKAVIRDIFDDWSDASGLNFIEVADTFGSYGEIRLTKLDFDTWGAFDPLYQGAAGFAYHPLGGDGYFYEPIGGDIFIDDKHSPGDGYFEHVVSHEIGHALGLAHPFEGYIPFGSQTSSYSVAKTIMTYNDEASLYAVSPMPIDISAMQFLYGGSSTANQENTIYTLEEGLLNTANSTYALEGNALYGDGARVSIIDVGGMDVIKLAGEFDQGVSINLQPESWSNVKNNQEHLFSKGVAESLTATFSDEPVIVSSENQIDAYGQIYIDSGTIIEDCELTEYSDVIFDNVASNNILCYGGDDLVSLSGGNDVVDGGLGVDQVALYGSAEYYVFNDAGDNNISVILSEAGKSDIENLFGDNFNEIILKNVEQVSFYASDGATSEPTGIENLANRGDDIPVVYEPVFSNISSTFNASSNHYTLTVNGEGISHASDYQTIQVDLRTDDGGILQLPAGNLGYKFNGSELYKGRIVDTGESSFSLQFDLPEGFVLPNYEFVSATIVTQNSETLGGVWDHSTPPTNFAQPLSLSFNKPGEGPVAEIVELDIQLNKLGIYETDVTYSGKISSTSNLNHVFVNAYAETSEYETPGRSYDLSFLLNSGDISDDGTFSVTNKAGDMPDAYDLFVMAWVASEDGEVRTYSTDSSTGNLAEVDSGVSVSYASWDWAPANYGNAENIFNIAGLYALPGDFIDIDVNHRDSEIENHLTYKEIQGIDWLSVSPSGEISGYVPTDTPSTYGSIADGNLIVDYSKVSGEHYEYFRVQHPFVAKDDGREMSIGDHWLNLHEALDGPVIVNSIGAGEYENFNGELIYGNTIRLADGSSYTIDSFDSFRNGVGIEVHTSKNDDYINLSGYTESDFYATDRDQMIDINTSPGNDIYIAPSFINDEGEFSGVLDNKYYFEFSKYLGLDSSQGLIINFQGEGKVEIIDQANNYHSFAENIHLVQTSQFSNDEVHGDALNNYLYSRGGVDTFFGGGGVDTFTHATADTAWRGADYSAELDHKIIIKDYQKGEKIRIKNYNVEDFHKEGTVRFDENLQKTIIAKKLENGQFDDLVEIDGFWRIDDSYLDSGGTLTIKAKSLYDLDSPIIEGSNGNDHLEPMGSATRYDSGVEFFTQDLEIYGHKGTDKIAGGAGDDILDGGEESDLRSDGRDYDADGNLIIDRVYYLDAKNGITANFETGIVSDDGFGGTDTVSNFERVYGSYHDDDVHLSHDIYRGYTPLYGNDKITGPSTIDIVNNSYMGYWNLENTSSGSEHGADPDVTEAHIIFDFDAGTVDKFITGGDFDVKPDGQADYQDTFSGAIEGVVGSRGADIIYGHSSDGKSTIIDGDRSWYYGWLDGYHGDDTVIALGSGDDYLRGGGGDDILIVAGGGEYEKILGHGGSTNYPNYIDTDDDTFVIGGSTQHVYLADYELGEDIILLDYDISGIDAFETAYDFSTDYTSVTVKDGENTLEDRLFIRGNVKVSGVESTTFNNDALNGSSDPSLNNTTVDTKLVLERSTDVPAETILGGEGDDFIIGEGGSEYIRTGGGDDEVYAGAGADVVVVEGQGDLSVDVGADTDSDTVRVDSSFAGTLLIKNADTSDTVEIMRDTGAWSVDEEGTIVIEMGGQDTITIENYLSYDEIQDMYVSTGPVITATGYTPFDLGFGDLSLVSVRGSNYTDDLLYSPSYNAAAEEGVFYNASGWDGDDVIYGGGGTQQLLGGEGIDTFHLSSDGQSTLIVGDRESSAGRTQAANDGDLPSLSSINTDFGDAVYLGWLKSEITLSEQGAGHFRIEHAGTGSVIDLYDVEELYFSDGEYKALTEGRVIGGDDWIGDAAGLDIEYEQHNVSFQVDGSTLKVLASATVSVTEEQFSPETVWVLDAATFYYASDWPSISTADWESWGYTRTEETMSLGVQTFDKELDGVVIWEGPRSEVDAFEFADGVSINVINVSSEDIAGDPVFDTIGTEGIDLIFGSAGDDLIDGKGGDDIIFGGDGDDVIIGGEGDDVIIGGDGADILRGDGVDGNDAAVAAWNTAASGFNSANPDNAIVFDENMLSLDNGGTSAGGDGDDVIIGGDGLDDIKSGDGQNFVTSGKADIDGDGQANLDLINQNIEDHQYLLDDEDWV